MGLICGFGGNFAIRQWSICGGQIISISQNSALFSLLGTFYGGNGQTTFGLPDLRGRAPIGFGQSPGTSNYVIGQRSGSETHTLSLGQMPVHNHTAALTGSTIEVSGAVAVKASSSAGSTNNPVGGYMAAPPNIGTSKTPEIKPFTTTLPTTTMAADSTVFAGTGSIQGGQITVNNNGASQPFTILQPVQVINWLICMQGLYPPRN